MTPTDEVEVFRSLDQLETEMVAGALADAGISYTVRAEMAGGLKLTGIDSHWAPGHSRVLYVPGDAAEEAREVLASMRGGPPVLHLVDSEPGGRGFHARRKRAIGLVVLLPFLVGLSFALVAVLRELAR